MNQNELYHHGVKGMKWGIRRYQNKDGSLTAKGRKKLSKQYAKYESKGGKALRRHYREVYVGAYNKTARKVNSEGIDKFNASQEKKYGKTLPKDTDTIKTFQNILKKSYLRT